jgi:DNA modification methylase
MKLELVKVKDLILDPRNARLHNKKNLEAIEGSFKDFQQQKNIVINQENVVVAGNGTVMAAIASGTEDLFAYRTPLDKAKQKAFALADNRTAELATWDDKVLNEILEELKAEEYAVDDIGFDLDEFGLAKNEGLTEDDAVPEVAQNVHSVNRGDIWQLGNHRLMCGDSTAKGDVEKLMAGEKADMVFTDPPYGMNLDTDYSKLPSTKAKGNKKYSAIVGDNQPFDPSLILSVFSDCSEIILFGADYYAEHLPQGSWYVWDKRVTENFDAMIGSAFELAWSKRKHKREIARFNNTLFSGEAEARNKVHPTQKPTKLIEWFLERIKGKILVDLFLGSGSTLIACEKTNRKCYGMEIDPHYCSVIIERWQQFTGNTAKLVSKTDGKP